MKKISCFLLIVILSFSLCGCFDAVEIDETAYVIALGIDKAEDDGYTYTFQLSAPLATMSSEGSTGGAESKDGENPTVRNISITAPDFYIARNMTNNFLSKRVDMSHLKLIVFSRSVDSDGFLRHSQFMLKEREVRPHTAVALASTLAEDYLKSINPELEANTAKYYELMALRSNNVYSPTKRLSDFVDEIKSGSGVSVLPVAYPTTEAQPQTLTTKNELWVGTETAQIKSGRAGFRGMAIFKDGEVAGLTNGDDAMIFNILCRDIKSCTIAVKNPFADNSLITFRLVVPHKAMYSVDNSKKPCHIVVSQGFSIEFLGGSLPEGFTSHENLYYYADSVITQRFSEYFYTLSNGYRADVMNIGNYFKKNFHTQSAWEGFDWESTFQSAEFEVDIYFI